VRCCCDLVCLDIISSSSPCRRVRGVWRYLPNLPSDAIVTTSGIRIRKENIKVKLFQKESGFAHMMIVVVVAVLAVGVIGGVVYKNESHANNAVCWPQIYSTNGVGSRFCVSTIQHMVSTATGMGFSAHGGFDGLYGPYTKSVVKVFQGKHGLTPDGVVGPKTWYQLCAYRGDANYNGYRAAAGCPGTTPVGHTRG